ncbi:unnamed protein product [Coregonus sp. 'balchen']|nr:unnamed protein product [Coregonus sp. 'balchen']
MEAGQALPSLLHWSFLTVATKWLTLKEIEGQVYSEPHVSSLEALAPVSSSPVSGGDPCRSMSAAQTQKDSEGPWGLDSLGLSQRELVLAEALQMEYDALSRLKQDKGVDSQGTSSQGGGKVPKQLPWEGQTQVDRPLPPCPSLSPPGRSLLRGLSCSDPSLHHLQPGGSHSPQPSPARATSPQGSHSKEPIYILESPGKGDYLSSSYGESGSTYGSSLTLPKGFPPPPDDPPPAVPPRTPLPPSSEPFLPPRPATTPRDVNLFTPDVDKPKLSSGEMLNYESLNDALSKLNGDWPSPRGRRANGDQSGKPVARGSKTLPPQVPPRTYLPIQKSNKNQHRVSAVPVSLGPRLNGFGYELFQVLRSTYPCSDRSKNTGFVWSPSVGPEELQQGLGVSIKVTVISDHFKEPLTFTCDGSSTVDLLIYQTLCYAHEDLDHIDVDHYLLKVCDRGYTLLDRGYTLLDLGCTLLDRGYTLLDLGYTLLDRGYTLLDRGYTLLDSGYILIDLGCTLLDRGYTLLDRGYTLLDRGYTLLDRGYTLLDRGYTLLDRGYTLLDRGYTLLDRGYTLLDRCYTLLDRGYTLLDHDEMASTMNHSILLQERPIKQTVTREALTLLLDTFQNEAESFLLSEVELVLHVERLVQSLKALCSSLAAVETPDITSALNQLPACPCRLQPRDSSVLAIRENRAAILDLVELYCSTFNANFHTTVQSNRHTAPTQEAGLVTNVLSFSVYAAHRIPIIWAASYEGFFLSCSLTHGGAELCAPQHTSKQQVSKYLFHLVVWDQRVCFPVQINQLPRETQMQVTLYASALPPPGGAEEKGSKQRRSIESLGWVTMPLFNFRHILTCGRKLLGLWPSTPGSNAHSSSPNFSQPDSVILQVDFPTSSFEVLFSTPPPAEFSPQYDFSRLDQHSQRQLQDVLHKKSLFWLTPEDKRLLWEKRSFCQSESGALPLVLASAPCWEWACLSDIYALLRQWACLNHHDALGLLHASFPDQELRHTAVQWMDSISDPELLDFLPQLVQALKYECYLDSPLVRFLLRRAIGDMRIAHYLFWLLKDTLQDSQFSGRYQHLLAGLLCCVGRGLREEFDRQCWLVTILAKVAQRVRDTSPSSRQAILREGLEEVKQFFSGSSSCRLPLNPGMLVKAINIQLCSYFNSNAVPLKLSFQNLDPRGDNINVIFKSGDDLRQDMLTLQIIRIMNKIWIQEGLDMRMGEHGVTGSFKDRPLADWLQKHNPTEDEYEKAVENFIYSCAGCCVATYILGICDRHNDNIMLKTSGHMFHIDFGKFLGHAQMFGNIKRDRAPFVFTSDMAYTDGLILNLFVCRHIRTYSSSKGYAFVVKVEREGQQGSVLVQRSFEEFYELHSKLRLIFPSSKLPSRFLIGRSRGEAMADRRKDELNGYVWHLVHAAPEVAQQPLQEGTDPDPYVKLYLLPDPQKTSKRKTKAARRTCNPTYNEMLVYDRIPRGDLQQRVIHLRVLGDGAFWENTLLGEVFIPLKTLTPGQCWADWHQLGTPSTDSTH